MFVLFFFMAPLGHTTNDAHIAPVQTMMSCQQLTKCELLPLLLLGKQKIVWKTLTGNCGQIIHLRYSMKSLKVINDFIRGCLFWLSIGNSQVFIVLTYIRG